MLITHQNYIIYKTLIKQRNNMENQNSLDQQVNFKPNNWKEMLEYYIQDEMSQQNPNLKKSYNEKEKETFEEFYNYLKLSSESNNDSEIPKFFFKNPLVFNELQIQVKSEAKHRYLANIANEIPDKKKLREVFFLLKKSISPPHDNTERINYKDFKKVGECYGPVIKQYFTANTFLKFDKDKYGRIEILAFFHYLVKKTNSIENKINICYHDVYNSGFLNDKDLENYIKEEFKQFYFYDELSEDIKEYYLLVAQRKFFFFLDPKRTGRIFINDIVCSPILTEFLEMKEKTVHSESQNNWFSNANFFLIYRKYIDLDKDRNGMLSKEELIRYKPGLTWIFIDRIFEEYQKYENAFDFKQFIDFCLAMENRKAHSAIQYFWRAIDVYHKNQMDTFIINLFFRQIVKKLTNRNKPEYKVDDIKDEIWDMVKPKNMNYLTYEDIIGSSHSEIILPLLFDAKAFFEHDQREVPGVDEFQELEEEYSEMSQIS